MRAGASLAAPAARAATMSTLTPRRLAAWPKRLAGSLFHGASGRAWAVLAVPCLLYVLHALVFRSWIVDDAAISFAYARSLAQGFGLVAQPGRPPVEGFSNLTWTILLAPFWALRLFHPVLTPKLLSTGLVFVSYGLLQRLLARSAHASRFLTVAVLSLLSVNSSFVIWTTSGLENALYVCLLCGLCYWTMRAAEVAPSQVRPVAALLGGLAALTALTRPDGLLFVAVFPAWLLFQAVSRRTWPPKNAWLSLGTYLLVFGLLYGGYLAFRAAYFGDLFPNTYYAKGGPSVHTALAVLLLQGDTLARLRDLLTSVAGAAGMLVLGGVFGATCILLGAGKLRPTHLLWLLFVLVSAAVYLLLPPDWMGEFRFATPFFVFFYPYAALIGAALLGALPRLPARVPRLAAVALVGASVFLFVPRSLQFARQPTAPLATVTALTLKVNAYADRLSLANASLLLPDIGGALLYSRLTIHDLAGLTDKTIARVIGRDPWALYDYVFETLKPTFIQTHSFWSALVYLEQDARFRRDYLPIYEEQDGWALQTLGLTRLSGEYVRRDAVSAQLPRLFELRGQHGAADASYEDFLLAMGYPALPSAAALQRLTPLDLDIGGVARVLGYALEPPAVRPGQALTITVHWGPLASTDRPYTVFVHLVDPVLGSLAQRDTYPLDGAYATTVWIPGRPFVDTYVLSLPETAPATSAATVVVGLYDLQTLDRLPVTDPATGLAAPQAWAELGRIEVLP